MSNDLKLKIRRARTHTLIAAWKSLNIYKWPSGWPAKESSGVRDDWSAMQEVAAEIGRRVIMGKIPVAAP